MKDELTMAYGLNVALRMLGRLFLVLPLVSMVTSMISSPSQHCVLFRQMYVQLRTFTMENGFKILEPVDKIKGSETGLIVGMGLILSCLCFLSLIGDSIALTVIMLIRTSGLLGLQTHYQQVSINQSTSWSFIRICLYFGIYLIMLDRHYLVPAESKQQTEARDHKSE